MEGKMRIETDIKRFVRSKTFTLVVLLLLLIVIFTIATGGSFLKAGNIRSILNSLVIVTFLAIGEGFLIIYGNIDLSLGTVGTMCGCIMGVTVTNWGLSWYLGFIGAFYRHFMRFSQRCNGQQIKLSAVYCNACDEIDCRKPVVYYN